MVPIEVLRPHPLHALARRIFVAAVGVAGADQAAAGRALMLSAWIFLQCQKLTHRGRRRLSVLAVGGTWSSGNEMTSLERPYLVACLSSKN